MKLTWGRVDHGPLPSSNQQSQRCQHVRSPAANQGKYFNKEQKRRLNRRSTYHHSAKVTSHLVKSWCTKLATNGKSKVSSFVIRGNTSKQRGSLNLMPQVRPAPALTTPASSPNLSNTFRNKLLHKNFFVDQRFESGACDDDFHGKPVLLKIEVH